MTVFFGSSICPFRPVPLTMTQALRLNSGSAFGTKVGGMRKLLILILILTSALTICCMATSAAAAISCTISMTNTAFGSVNVLAGSAVDVTSTATVTCSGATANATYRFCTDIKSGTDVSGNQRRMASGANRLNFDLYKDSARTVQWGSYTNSFLGGGSQNDFTSNASGNISATITVFARLAANQQTAIPGAYSESMTGATNNDLQYGSLASAGSCPIGASTAQYSFTVSATATTNCNVSATTLNFGSTSTLSSIVDGSGTLTTTCTSTTPYNIGLNAGTGAGATVAIRKMTGGANTINYSLYTDSARTTVWGNTVGTNTVAGTGSGLAQNSTVFGRVPVQTTPAPAVYSDTIVATITY